MKLTVERCCCMSLRTGGLVIGWLSIALYSAAILNKIYRLISPEASEITIGSHTIHGPSNGVGIIVVDLVFSAMLIYGIKKNKHDWLLPSLVLKAFGILIAGPVALVALIALCFISDATNTGFLIFVVVFVALIIALHIWEWVVIYSLYLEIRMSGLMPLNERGPSQFV